MFPDFQYLFQYLFGVDIPALSIIKTFGFCVAIAFLFGAWALGSELKRKQKEGLFEPEIVEETVGDPAGSQELITLFLLGFIVGFKLIGLFSQSVDLSDPAAYLFSLSGSWVGGLVLGALLSYSRYYNKKRHRLDKPVTRKMAIYPHHRVWDIIFIAAIAGFAGAKIFNAFETWEDFIHDPIGNLFSPAGLTFYGGLICATLALFWYARKKHFSFRQLCDAAAPALILAYGLGRMGCQFAGDGDWGIYNSAYVTQADQSLKKGSPEAFTLAVEQYPNAFVEFGHPPQVPHLNVPGPEWLPTWMVAQNYPHNVNNAGISIAGHEGQYSHVLPGGVFPTAMYEIVACLLIFLLLWSIRRKFKYPLQMFSIYLIANGLERFFVEKIRVNYKYDWGWIHPTQAEIISTGLVLIGIALFFYAKKKGQSLQVKTADK